MTGSIDITLYNIARHDLKLTEAKSMEFVSSIKETAKDAIEIDKNALATKLDIEQIKLEIQQIKSALELKIEQTRSDLLKWFIGMFVVLAGMIIGLYFKG